MADNHICPMLHRPHGVGKLGPRATGPGPARAGTGSHEPCHFKANFLHGIAGDQSDQGGRIVPVKVDTLGACKQQQGFHARKLGNHLSGFIIVHAFNYIDSLGAAAGQFHFANLFLVHGIVIIDDGNRTLFGGALQQAADVLLLLRIVEMVMLYQYLPHAILRADEAAVIVHENCLPLRAIIHLILLGIAAKLMPRACDVIQPPHFRRAAGNQQHSRAQSRAQPLENIIIHCAFALLD